MVSVDATEKERMRVVILGEARWLKPPTLARHHVTICMSCFTTGGPGEEQRISLYQPEEFVKGQKETPPVQPPPRILLSGIHLGCLNKAYTTRKDSESEWLAKDNPETNPITIKLQAMWQSSSPGFPFPVKSLAFVSTCPLGQFISEG